MCWLLSFPSFLDVQVQFLNSKLLDLWAFQLISMRQLTFLIALRRCLCQRFLIMQLLLLDIQVQRVSDYIYILLIQWVLRMFRVMRDLPSWLKVQTVLSWTLRVRNRPILRLRLLLMRLLVLRRCILMLKHCASVLIQLSEHTHSFFLLQSKHSLRIRFEKSLRSLWCWSFLRLPLRFLNVTRFTHTSLSLLQPTPKRIGV